MASDLRPRDGRTTNTRERILQVAEQLYIAGGYEHINLQVIAGQVGVSKTALFHHFKNKQELFYATLLHMLTSYGAMFTGALESVGVRERLRRIMLGLVQQEPFDMPRFMREEYALLSAEQQAEVERAWRASLFDVVWRVLDEGRRAGELGAIDLSLATFAFMHLCMLLPREGDAFQRSLTAAGDAASTERAIDALLDLYLNGVGPHPQGAAGTTQPQRASPGD